MFNIHARRGITLGTLTAAALLLAVPSALAAPATTSPEGIGIEATGAVTVAPTPDATSANPTPAPVASVGVPGILTANTVAASVSGNTTTASVAGLTAISGAPVAISSGAISSTCTANSDGTFTESSSISNLAIAGLTIPTNPAPNTTLTIPLVGTVTLNEQVAGPTAGSVTVTAVHLHFNLPSQDIYIASSTCGPFTQPVPMASGAGLATGLGAAGAAATGVIIAVLLRRRRTVHA